MPGRQRRSIAFTLVFALALAAALPGRLRAAEQTVLGAKLLLRNPTVDVTKRRVLATGKEGAGSENTVVGNPVVDGATLRVVTSGGTASDQTFDLPAAGWLARGTFGFQYSNARTGGAVKKVLLARTGSGGFLLKASIAGARGPVTVVPPNPGVEGSVVLAIAGGDTYCVTLGGAAGGVASKDDARAWLIKRATAELCPSTTSTTATTSTTVTTTTEASTTTTSSTNTTSTSTLTTTSTTTSTTTTITTTTTATTTTTTTTTAISTTTTTSTTTTLATTTTVTTTTRTTTTASTTTTTTTTTLVTTTTLLVEVNLLYVHGVKNCANERMNAQNGLADVELAVDTEAPTRIATYELAHPGTVVVVRSALANLYTATPSGFHPSDSTDPLNMDDWEVGDPGCSTTQQGDPCTTAYEWRYRLAQEINRTFPAPAKNIILIGHSAGARVSMEVAANVGTGGVGSTNWGVQSRIAGVVTLHGMVNEIGSSKYDVVGISSFESSCKFGDAVMGFGSSCAPGNGWCEYAGRVDGFPAADWVAQNKRALMLTSWASCSPSAWGGQNDGSLPYDAQASPWAVGLDMTPAPGQTWRVAHGQKYGSFCHSALTNSGDSTHAAARDAARDRILDWLFTAAPRVANTGSDSTSSAVPFNGFSSTFTMGTSCPSGEVDDNVTNGNKAPGIDVVGVCKHPGFVDGDDHAIALSEFTVTNGSTCNGTYKWKQAHDSSNSHNATFWWKTRSERSGGAPLVSTLPGS